MSRPDDRSGERAWDDGVPTFKERLGLAIRQNPVRGMVIAALFLLSLVFLVGGIIEFRDAIWGAIVDFASAVLAGDLPALLAVAVVLMGAGTATLLLRRG
ncbi:hypothetical protein [Halolamina salina]|uniref:Uncharacterized protein n=1 Tax=Halolamina salina TaxID=1220023 RepID=A0ABD6B5L5_9EURY